MVSMLGKDGQNANLTKVSQVKRSYFLLKKNPRQTFNESFPKTEKKLGAIEFPWVFFAGNSCVSFFSS